MARRQPKIRNDPTKELNRLLNEVFAGKYDAIQEVEVLYFIHSQCPDCFEWHDGKPAGTVLLFQCPLTKNEHAELINYDVYGSTDTS